MNCNLTSITAKSRTIMPQVHLRQFVDTDAPALFALTETNRAYLREWLPWLDDCTNVEDSLLFIQQAHHELTNNLSLTLGIFSTQQDTTASLLGVITFHTIDWPQKTASLGYWLSEDHQGQGIVTAACRELINIGFIEMYLDIIEINCAINNDKSQAIAKRLGFKKCNTDSKQKILYGISVDHILFTLYNQK